MTKYKKKVMDLNDSSNFQAMMSYEERTRLEHNTEKKLAYEDGLSFGISQGEQQKQFEIAINLFKNTSLSVEEISKNTNLPIEKLNQIQKSYRNDENFCRENTIDE